jgi:hypothetical protein
MRLSRKARGLYNDNWIQVTQIETDSMLYLIRNLENFEKDKAIRKGLGAAGAYLMSAGRTRLKRSMKSGSRGVTGNLLRSFKVRVKKWKPGVLVGFQQGEGGGSHAHLVDRGTDERFWKTKSHKSTGRVIGNAFWSDTEAQDYPKAIDKIYEGIERAVNRVNNRQ